MLSGNKAKCYRTFVTDQNLDIDFFGLQSHMKQGVNGDVINDRLNIMAGPELNNRLWITEFDVENKNVSNRAEDVEDFIRIVFAHPNTESIILWTWLREKQRPWQETPFNRALFEENLDIGDPKFESDYPFNPNEAGLTYLNLVKKEWNSSQTITQFENNFRLFKGLYSVKLLSESNQVLWDNKVMLDAAACPELVAFEFEDDEYLNSDDIDFVACKSIPVSPAYSGAKSALITDRTAGYGSIRYKLDSSHVGKEFKLKMAVKIATDDQTVYKAKVIKKNGDQYIQVHSQIIENNNQWFFVETEFVVETG